MSHASVMRSPLAVESGWNTVLGRVGFCGLDVFWMHGGPFAKVVDPLLLDIRGISAFCINTGNLSGLELVAADLFPVDLVLSVSYTHLTLPTNREV